VSDANLVLFFGDRDALEQGHHYEDLRGTFPKADIAGCSTSGQILSGVVSDGDAVALAVKFADTRIKLACCKLASFEDSASSGEVLGRDLAAPDLKAIFVLSDGIGVNASALIEGLTGAIGPSVPVMGGLAGDAARFERTLVAGNARPAPQKVVAIGFYGERLLVGHGSDGGWKVFGPPRRITRSINNILYELDNEPALDLYKRYLGEEASQLPGSALLFPLKVRDPMNPEHDVVRTIVGINETDRSLVFAGNVPTNYEAQLMRGTHYNLVEGAGNAALEAAHNTAGHDRFAVLVSCVGRKLLMGQRTAEETEAVLDRIGGAMSQIGFYSYGEISPHSATGMCELHNQTMTITTFAEAS
jgi:hypothetical protein